MLLLRQPSPLAGGFGSCCLIVLSLAGSPFLSAFYLFWGKQADVNKRLHSLKIPIADKVIANLNLLPEII
jgi:hypothetical protein